MNEQKEVKSYSALYLFKMLDEAINEINYINMQNQVIHLDKRAYDVLNNYNNKLFNIKIEPNTYRGIPIELFKDSYTDIYGIDHFVIFLINEKLSINYDDLVLFSKYLDESLGKKIIFREVRKGSQCVVFYYEDTTINVFYYSEIKHCVNELKEKRNDTREAIQI